MADRRLWFVCPSYGDVESFERVRTELLEEVEGTGALDELEPVFVLIDDTGGRDPQLERLAQLADTRVIDPPFNLGHQRALVFGLRRVAREMSDHDLVVTLDSDGEDQPADVGRLLAPLLSEPEDIRAVSLALRTKRRESPLFKALYLAFRGGFRLLTGTVIRTGNYAAFHGWLTRAVIFHPYFDLSYSSALRALDLRETLVPCERGVRYAGRSRMGLGKLLRHGLSMLMPFIDRIAVRALVGFSVTLALSLALAAVVVGVKLLSDHAIPGWATSTLLLLGVVSLASVGNLVVLFVAFAQFRGQALANLEESARERP